MRIPWFNDGPRAEVPTGAALPGPESAAPVRSVIAANPAERRAELSTAAPDKKTIVTATLRSLAALGVAGNTDSNAFFSRWNLEPDLQIADPLSAFFRETGRGVAEIESAAALMKVWGNPVPVCDFHNGVTKPTEFYRRNNDTAQLLRQFHCVALIVSETPNLTTIVIASVNPVAGGAVADHLRSIPGSTGIRPYVGLMRLTVQISQHLLASHFPNL